MPEVLWVAGLVEVGEMDSDALRFRIGDAMGADFVEARVHGWSGKEHETPSGLSVFRALHGWAKTRWRLAVNGVVPYADGSATGYRATDRTQNVNGIEWREFIKLTDHSYRWSTGWWNEVARIF